MSGSFFHAMAFTRSITGSAALIDRELTINKLIKINSCAHSSICILLPWSVENSYSGHRTRQSCGIFVDAFLSNGQEGAEIG